MRIVAARVGRFVETFRSAIGVSFKNPPDPPLDSNNLPNASYGANDKAGLIIVDGPVTWCRLYIDSEHRRGV